MKEIKGRIGQEEPVHTSDSSVLTIASAIQATWHLCALAHSGATQDYAYNRKDKFHRHKFTDNFGL